MAENSPKRPFVVAVSGGSGSGKTTLVDMLQDKLSCKAALIEMDNYYLDRSHVPKKERALLNYDHPDAIDGELLYEHIRALKEGKNISYPQYDFKNHVRSESKKFQPEKILIIDGIFALYHKKIAPLLDLKIYVDCDSDVRLSRRLLRDSKQRARAPESVISQYLATVKPMHEKYIEPTKYHADFMVPWHIKNQTSVSAIAAVIEASIVSE